MGEENDLLVKHLSAQGLNGTEIEHIFAKLTEHDEKTFHESVFDSIERDTFRLQDIISEARGETNA